MNFLNFYTEANNKINKFNTLWQIARVEAKDIKDVDQKIEHVKKCLFNNPSQENFGRITNWTSMTKLGYKNTSMESVQKFEDFLDFLDNHKLEFTAEDKDIDLHDVPEDVFWNVYNDLIHRSNNFQHKGKRPVTMSQYLAKMKEVGQERGIKLPEDKKSLAV